MNWLPTTSSSISAGRATGVAGSTNSPSTIASSSRACTELRRADRQGRLRRSRAHTRFIEQNHFGFLNQRFYADNIAAGNPVTDYRWYWKLNFDLVSMKREEDHHLAVMLEGAGMSDATFDLAGVSVMLAMPTNRDLPPPTVMALLATADLFRLRGIPFEIQMQVGCSLVEHARSEDCSLVPEKRQEPAVLGRFRHRLAGKGLSPPGGALDHARRGRRGLSRQEGPAALLRQRRRSRRSQHERIRLPPHEGHGPRLYVHPAPRHRGAGGAGEEAQVPRHRRADSASLPMRRGGRLRPREDMAFFSDVRALGYDVCLDPTVTLGHVGAKTYSGSIMDHMATIPAA